MCADSAHTCAAIYRRPMHTYATITCTFTVHRNLGNMSSLTDENLPVVVGQSVSSDPSPQSWSPSQRNGAHMHCPELHRYWPCPQPGASVVVVVVSPPHPCSSERSPQSLSPSHTHLPGMQRRSSTQWKLSPWQTTPVAFITRGDKIERRNQIYVKYVRICVQH